ncbi:MAG TPA: S8 family serine peptidase, partial [Planctomycetota bacterium]|nr:S8 family serine peptidase [Planctomycetota bacterium]
GRLAGWFVALALSSQLAAQTPEYERDGARLWRTDSGGRWLVDASTATLRLRASTYGAWRASLAVGSPLRRLLPVRANRLGWIDVQLPADLDVLDVLARLRADPRVEAAELSAIGAYDNVPNDALFAQQWHLRNTGQSGGTPGADIGAVSAWDFATGDPSVVIAIVDSGTQVNHPDLSSNIWGNAGEIAGNGLDDDGNGFTDDVNGWNFETNNGGVGGTAFHGTATAGTALARTNNLQGVCGIAGGFDPSNGCRGMILAVGNSAPLTAVIDDAIVYAADNGARVISMSLQIPQTAAIDAALQYAHDVRGVCLVAAAGNTNGGAITYPANQTRVLAIGSSGPTDARSGFSAIGPEMCVIAPGESIRTTTVSSNYTTQSGTSFSAPLAAGTVGLLFAALPSLAPDDARDVLQRSALDLGVPGFDPQTGHGRLSASSALALLAASDCDANGIYDPRQIANGVSQDLTGNKIPDECELVTYCTAKVNSLGCTPQIAGSGTPSASASSGFVVSASNVRNQRPGILLYGFAGRASLPFGGGTLCLSGALRRSSVVQSGGSPSGDDCSGALSLDMNAFARGALGGAPHHALSDPGARVGCQWWSSDPVPALPNQPSLTDALEYSIAP